jgi:hypothetical protein
MLYEFNGMYYTKTDFGFADESKVAPPLPPTEGRFDVVIDNDVISRLDLSPFQSATGMKNPLTGMQDCKLAIEI